MNKDGILSYLQSQLNTSIHKYWRNYRAYWGSHYAMPNNLSDTIPLGYDSAWLQDTHDDDGVEYQEASGLNVIKSCIDTLGSKVANQKVRPLFTPIAGDWESRRTIKQVQLFMDDLFYKENVNQKVTKSFKKACIYDEGAVFLDPFTFHITSLSPFSYAYIQSEYEYGLITKLLVRKAQCPKSQLKLYGIKDEQNKFQYKLDLFIDAEAGTKEIYLDGRKVKSEKYTGESAPITMIHFSMPLDGKRSTSLVDDLIKIQHRINDIDEAISVASRNSPLNTHFVPRGELNMRQLDNGAGNIVEYTPLPGMSSNPVVTSTPAFINDQYQKERSELIELAYRISGVSELSSQSQNPLGAGTSGAALQTMENVEAARFNTQMNEIIRAYVDIARLFFDVVDSDADILPADKNRAKLKWKDVLQERDKIKIEYSATASLSSDPETRLKMLGELNKMGVIQKEKISAYMDMPDIEDAFTQINSVNDAVDRIIAEALTMKEKELLKFNIPIFIDYASLEKEIIALQNQYYGQGGDRDEEIGRLQVLYNKVKEVMILEQKEGAQLTPSDIAEQEGSKDEEEGSEQFGTGATAQSAGAESGEITNEAQAAGIPQTPGLEPATADFASAAGGEAGRVA
jgi:hypothetical protein